MKQLIISYENEIQYPIVVEYDIEYWTYSIPEFENIEIVYSLSVDV